MISSNAVKLIKFKKPSNKLKKIIQGEIKIIKDLSSFITPEFNEVDFNSPITILLI